MPEIPQEQRKGCAVAVLVLVGLLAAGAIIGLFKHDTTYLSDGEAIARVELSWGDCVSTEDATVERLPSSAGFGEHASRVTTSDGAEWIVGAAKTKGAAVGNDVANQDADNCS